MSVRSEMPCPPLLSLPTSTVISPTCRPAGTRLTRSPGGSLRCRRSTAGASANNCSPATPSTRSDAHTGPSGYNVQYLVATLAREAGIAQRLIPHGLRHSAITVGLDAGVSLRDMQDFARHADPKTTRRYDRSRNALNRHDIYAIAHYLAGGT